MTDSRTPKAIAADLAKLHEDANLAFVPVNVQRAPELIVEFAGAVGEQLDADVEPAPAANDATVTP